MNNYDEQKIEWLKGELALLVKNGSVDSAELILDGFGSYTIAFKPRCGSIPVTINIKDQDKLIASFKAGGDNDN